MMKQLMVTSSPHIRDRVTTRSIMQKVCLALAPAGIMGILNFGWNALGLIAASVITAVISEYLFEYVSHKRVTVGDWSAVVTGLLLAYNLPADAPVWIAVIGSFLAVVLVKQCFGGIGQNFMNPALTARAILFVSWSGIMASYPQGNLTQNLAAIGTWFGGEAQGFADTVAGATPLATLNAGSVEGLNFLDLLIGNHGGVLGETCAIALLLGGVWLIAVRIIDWKIPVCMIGTLFLCYLLKDGAEIAVYQVFAGGLMLGAFCMATDYATSPVSQTGKVIMGVACGLLVFVIRAFANYAEGVSFAILFLNACTPLIDRFTAPKPFGEVKKHG